MIIIRNAAATAIVALCLSSTGPATAQMREAFDVRIPTTDLDFASAAGRDRLNARVRAAISKVCVSELEGLRGVMDADRCRANMRRSATTRIAALNASIAKVRLVAR